MPSTPTRVTSSKVEALGHHLGTHHDVVLVPGELRQQLFVGVLSGGGVLIHPQHPGLGEQLRQFLLGLLGAEAPVEQLAAAGGAGLGGRVELGAAVVAEQLVACLVVDHGDAALGALEHLAAVVALGHGLIAPPVEQQDGLLARVEVAPDGVLHGKADLPGLPAASSARISTICTLGSGLPP